jgi:glutathione synthase/RimK-type ligase-like ATP-grasp enzyme
MKNIFVLTVEDDFHTKRVKGILEKKYNIFLIELKRETYGKDWTITSLTYRNDLKTIINFDGKEYVDDQIHSFWLRRNFHLESSDQSPTPEQEYISAQTAIHVNSCIRLLAEKVFFINRPYANWNCNSKIVQAVHAKDCGLSLPNSFQGGSPNLLNNFISAHSEKEKLCIKPIEASHLKLNQENTLAHYTTLFERRPANELESVKDCPVIIQKFISKDYEIRATLIGNKIFAASIDTKTANEAAQIDWRHYDWANTPYYPIELPVDISRKIIKHANILGLVYGAYDLIKTPENEYYFLEVNAQGQWLWVEDLTGLKISEALADCLVTANV